MSYEERIVSEAEKLFMKYGIRAVTMDKIANELGISKRTIYEHFEDKDSLLTQVIWNKAQKQKLLFYDLMKKADNVIEVIFTIIETAFSQIRDENPTFMIDLKRYHHKVFKELSSRGGIRNSELTIALLNRGVLEGIFRDDISIELVDEGLQGFIDTIHTNDLFHSSKYSRYEILDNLLFNFLRGISTDRGVELIIKHREKIVINKNGYKNEN